MCISSAHNPKGTAAAMKKAVINGIIASRPWTFTAAVIPVVLSTAILRKTLDISLVSKEFATASIVPILVQAAANLLNSFLDHKAGVDKKETAGDRAIVDGLISPENAVRVSTACYVLAFLLSAPYLLQYTNTISCIFLCGILLSIFYTANPISLKYICLGDIAIFLAFGPLLMQYTAILLTGAVQPSLNLYTIPVGLLTEAILHANNIRDIKGDLKAGITTLACTIGFERARQLYVVFVYGAYVISLVMAFTHDWGCAFVILSFPLAYKNVMDIEPNPQKMKDMDARTAEMHLFFGLLLIGGISVSSAFQN